MEARRRAGGAPVSRAGLKCMPCSAAGVQKAMTLVEYGKPYVVTQHALPVPTGSEVLVRTTYAGVCHSELHMWEGKWNLGGGKQLPSDPKQLPCVLGHEIEGEVLAAGSDVPAGFLGNSCECAGCSRY